MRNIVKIGALCAAAGLASGCAHVRFEYREFDPAGKVVKAATYYSSKDVAGKVSVDPATGIWTLDLTSTGSTATRAGGEAAAGTLDALAKAAGTAAGIAAKEAVK